MQDIKQQKKCSHGECRACHNGVNEDNPTGQKGICPYQQREMEKGEHKYWCGGCDEPFILKGKVEKCPECGSDEIGLDEPVIRTPQQ